MLNDERYLMEAAELARKGLGHTRPNPAVGAVVVKGGRVIGRGWHRRAGCDHAEVAAIKDAAKMGCSAKGAAIYVTLEPCSSPGKVGACTDAIIAAGLKRVVYGSVDPNPANRGKARRALSKAGVSCERTTSAKIADACDDLIKGFRKHVTTGLPYVTVKIAMSLDGRICDDFGQARWISSGKSRKATGKLRETVDAIMVGAETVRKDNPSLLSHGRRNDDLVRVVVTKSGKLPNNAQVFADGKNRTVVLKVGADGKADSLKTAMMELGRMGVMHVLCEGGLKLATALSDDGLVDEWITVLAPCVIGHRPISGKRIFKPTGDIILKYRCLPG